MKKPSILVEFVGIAQKTENWMMADVVWMRGPIVFITIWVHERGVPLNKNQKFRSDFTDHIPRQPQRSLSPPYCFTHLLWLFGIWHLHFCSSSADQFTWTSSDPNLFLIPTSSASMASHLKLLSFPFRYFSHFISKANLLICFFKGKNYSSINLH